MINSLSFAEFVTELDKRVETGALRRVPAPDKPHLAIYNYTDRCTYERLWDDFTVAARGLVVDTIKQRVIARPFKKFFNLGEPGHTLADLPTGSPEAHEKLDGSLGICFFDGEGWQINTRGSWTSEQARWATQHLTRYFDVDTLVRGSTYLFEIVYPENQIVVRYDYEGLVLLGIVDTETGEEASRHEAEVAAAHLGCRVARLDPRPYTEILDSDDANAEGFVLRYPDGYRVKIKFPSYLRRHRLASRVAPLGVWDVLAAGRDIDSFQRELPEELLVDFNVIFDLLYDGFRLILERNIDLHEQTKGLTDKEVAALDLPGLDKSDLFLRRRLGKRWWIASSTKIWRRLRPTGNVLAGYTPGDRLRRVQSSD
jgi:RNA ligase